MSQPPPPKPPGWYPDPYRQAPFRWWDGTNWSQQTSQGQPQTSDGGSKGWKLFLIITAAIVAAVVILVVGCSALVSSSLDSEGSGEPSDTLTRADLPSGAVLVERSRDRGENPDLGLDASFPASKSRYYLLVETSPPAKITVITSVSCQTPDYSKSVNRDIDTSDLLDQATEYGTSFKLPKGWKRGWVCDVSALGSADSPEGETTTVTTSLYRSR